MISTLKEVREAMIKGRLGMHQADWSRTFTKLDALISQRAAGDDGLAQQYTKLSAHCKMLEDKLIAQEKAAPVARCCLHDSDCAVHNMPAYPAGPCDCSQTFVSSPNLGIVTTVSYQLAQRELNRLVENNFGQMPRNDEWADKVLLARDTFEASRNRSQE